MMFMRWLFTVVFLKRLCCVGSQKADLIRGIKIWVQFQNFTKTHENSEWMNKCTDLDLDTSLIHLSHVDLSRKGDGPRRKLRVLYLATLRSLFIMSDRWIFHFYMALANHRDYDVTLWGIGMPGFNTHETTKANIERWFLDPNFDIVHTNWIYHETGRGRADSDLERGKFGNRADEFADLPGNPMITTMVHEVGWNGLEKLIHPNIVFVVYEQFLGVKTSIDVCGNRYNKSDCGMNPYLSSLIGLCSTAGGLCSKNQTRTMLAYIPHGVYEPLYSAIPVVDENSKKHNVLLVGAVHRDIYPLRHTAQQAMRYTNVMSQLRHPGYAMSWDESLLELCKYFPKNTRAQQRRYMDSLAHSRMCLIGTASQLVDNCPVVAWSIRKYYEAMAAGCVVVGDVPADSRVAPYVAVRLTGQSVVELAWSVEYAMQHYKTGSYDKLKAAAREHVLKHFSYDVLIGKYFTPAIMAYMAANNRATSNLSGEDAEKWGLNLTWKGERDGGGVFKRTLSSIIVRNDKCALTPGGVRGNQSTAVMCNATDGLREFCAAQQLC